MASKYNFNLDQGSTWIRTLHWLKPDNSPMETANFSARMQIRPNINGKILMELSTENGRIEMDDNGVIILKLTALETSSITIASAIYDLEIFYTDSVTNEEIVNRIIEGKFLVNFEVTK